MWTRAELKEKAKEDVKRSYWPLVLVSFIVAFLTGGGGGGGGSSAGSSSSNDFANSSMSTEELMALVIGILAVVLVIVLVAMIIGVLWVTFITNPIMVGARRYFIEATYGEKTAGEIGKLFMCFAKGKYMNPVKILFFRDLYVWLWSLLFIIPGIVKSYEYYMLPYILAENPDISKEDAFRLSKEMMDGEKWNTFVLGLSFIGWNILSVFTCGLLSIFYINPYMNMTYAHLYETLKHRASMNYYDHTLGQDAAYAYGNPGAYAQSNNMSANTYGGQSVSQPVAPVQAGEMFNPSAPIEDDFDSKPNDDLYKLPEDNE